ncbi:MAG: NAD(P)H-binding protein [Actinomycetota bacterium]
MALAIMGAAGNVGGKVADLLLRAGEEIRVLQHARDLSELAARGAEVVTGEATNVDDLRALFAGASTAFVMLPENVADPDFVGNREIMSRSITDALELEGVSHIVALSGVGAGEADAPGPPGGLHGFERHLDRLEAANLLLLRPAFYMDYLLAALPLIQAAGVNGSAVRPDLEVPMVATADVAREVAERMRGRDFAGRSVRVLLGPEVVTMPEATREIGARIGHPDLDYVPFPPEQVVAALTQAGMSEQVAGLIVEMQMALNAGIYFEGVDRAAAVTTATTLSEFLDVALSDDDLQSEGAR